MGRPSRYKAEIEPHLDEIRKAVEAGATDKEIADAFGLSERCVNFYSGGDSINKSADSRSVTFTEKADGNAISECVFHALFRLLYYFS